MHCAAPLQSAVASNLEEFRNKYESKVANRLACDTQAHISSVFDAIQEIIYPVRVRNHHGRPAELPREEQRKAALASARLICT
jgi:hypothetical protein